MGSDVPQRQLVDSRKGERGSALIVAIMFMAVLFAITLAAAKVRVASAKDVEDQNAQQNAYWNARSGTATVQASLLTDVPAAFDSDVVRARGLAGGALVTAFDPPCYSPSCVNKPVMNTDGGRTSYPISECTSLLGNIDAWALVRGVPVAENYAASHGYGATLARVAVLREYARQQMVGSSSIESAYILEFQIDAIASDQGRLRTSGTIMLSPSRVACETLVSLDASPTSILIGSSSTLTVTYQAANTIVLKDSNGNAIDTRTGLNETAAPQTITFTVSPTATTTYRAEATGSGGCGAISGARIVTVTFPPPEISFSINSACISRGQSATLSWSVKYASNVTITGGGLNQSYSGAPTSVISGSLAVSPVVDTTYTLAATGPGGSNQAQASVTVTQPFSIDSFAASTYCVTPGANIDLSWAITNAESANINGIAVSPSSGTLRVNPTETTTYTLSASRTGCSGPETITRALTVYLTAVPGASFSANPAHIALGQSTSLQWTTTDAMTADITPSPIAGSGLSGPTSVTPVSSGSLLVTPTQAGTFTYVLTATNTACSTQQVQQTATLIVDPGSGSNTNQSAKNEVVAPHNNMYIVGFVETFADGHIRADASSGGMGNEIVNGYWIKTTYDYHVILSKDGVQFKDITFSYEHTPAKPYGDVTVFEIPAAQVPAGAGPVTMWAELTGTVYNKVYTETLHTTIDTTKPDDTKFPGDSPPPVPVYGKFASIGECNGDIPGACTNQKTNLGLQW